MDPERYTAREEAAQWLAKLDRGLRQGEGLKLRQWLQQSAHRAAIVEVARQRAAPDVMALLTELFPISLQSVAQEPPRGATGILVAVGLLPVSSSWVFGLSTASDSRNSRPWDLRSMTPTGLCTRP